MNDFELIRGKAVYVLFICFLIFASIPNNAQDARVQEIDKTRPSNCEDILNQLDRAMLANSREQGRMLILIFRPGAREYGKEVVPKRIAKIRQYLQQRGHLSKTVLAEADRNEGLGKLELYLSGKLFSELYFVHNNKAGVCIE